MAELTTPPSPPTPPLLPSPAWTAAQSHGQFSAVAWLRWCILANSFRRKGGVGELVGRLLLYALLLGFLFLPTLGAGAGAFYFTQAGPLARLAWLLWGTFLLAQLLNINLGQPGTTFDPNELIRFPMRLRQFVLLRLSFGLLTPGSLLPAMMCLAMAVGVSLAQPALGFPAFVALGLFALTNVLFNRMLFAWIDRWLSTRRAREIFTALLFAGSFGFQWANVNFNPAYGMRSKHIPHSRFVDGLLRASHRAQPALAMLPPGLTTRSLQQALAGHGFTFTLLTAAGALYGAAFLAIFALRMATEFRGERLSDVAQGGSASRTSLPGIVPVPALPRSSPLAPRSRFALSPAILAVMGKEMLYTRRNVGLLYGLLTPLAMVALFAGRMATRGSAVWLFPGTLAYVLLGIMPLSYNSFGLEGTGVRFYFLAPVRMRDVIFAKNLVGFALAAVYTLGAAAVIVAVAGRPSLEIALPCLLWAAATLLTGTSLGNRRSLAVPKRISLAKTMNKQASPLSALMSMGVLLVLAALGAGLLWLARRFHLPWLPFAGFAAMLAGALALYTAGLRSIDRYAADHRESLFEELCKS